MEGAGLPPSSYVMVKEANLLWPEVPAMVKVTSLALPVQVPSSYVPTSEVMALEPSPEANPKEISVRT